MVGSEYMDPIDFKVDYNPWEAASIYEFRYFCCPECDCKSHNKQEFVDHTYNYHSWALETLHQISDGSLDDIEFPNDQHVEIQIGIKKEYLTDEANHFEIAEDLSSNIVGNLNGKTQASLQFEKRKQKVKENPESEHSSFGHQKSLNPHSKKLEAWKEEYYVDGKFVCPECGKKFSQFGNFQQHLDRKDHIEVKREIDAKFDKNSKTNDIIDIKYDPLEENKSEQCETDEQAYSYNFKVNEQGKFVCEKCDTLYNLKASLKSHVDEKHRNLTPFQCLQCNFACFRKEHLMKHFKIKHRKMIPCEVKGDDDIPIENDVYIKGCIKAKNRGFWRKDESEKLSQRGYENVILIDGKKQFKCPSCDKIFKSRSVLCLHIDSIHEKKKPYHCTKCDYRSSTKCQLKAHDNQVHEKNYTVKCDKCYKGFFSKRNLEIHIASVHEKMKPHTCDICGKSYTQIGALNLHTRTIHEGIKYVNIKYCHICPYKTSSKSKLDYHIALKHELKVNSIDETILNEIREHPKIAAVIGKKLGKMKKTSCKICEKNVYDKPAHNKEHHKGRVKCPKCDEEFSSYKEAIIHIELRHAKSPCAICGEIVLTKRLKRHIAMKHTAIEDRKFKCTLCPKAFVNNKGLSEHMNTHTGEKPYICRFCGKGSASFGTHRGHERSHEGQKRTK